MANEYMLWSLLMFVTIIHERFCAAKYKATIYPLTVVGMSLFIFMLESLSPERATLLAVISSACLVNHWVDTKRTTVSDIILSVCSILGLVYSIEYFIILFLINTFINKGKIPEVMMLIASFVGLYLFKAVEFNETLMLTITIVLFICVGVLKFINFLDATAEGFRKDVLIIHCYFIYFFEIFGTTDLIFKRSDVLVLLIVVILILFTLLLKSSIRSNFLIEAVSIVVGAALVPFAGLEIGLTAFLILKLFNTCYYFSNVGRVNDSFILLILSASFMLFVGDTTIVGLIIDNQNTLQSAIFFMLFLSCITMVYRSQLGKKINNLSEGFVVKAFLLGPFGVMLMMVLMYANRADLSWSFQNVLIIYLLITVVLFLGEKINISFLISADGIGRRCIKISNKLEVVGDRMARLTMTLGEMLKGLVQVLGWIFNKLEDSLSGLLLIANYDFDKINLTKYTVQALLLLLLILFSWVYLWI